MSNETDLDWLVRETKGEWFGNSTNIARDGLEDYLWASKSVQEVVHRYPGYHWFTKAEYLARRAELQNKPSFEDHPDAKCFVQDGYGNWLKNTLTSDAEAVSDFWRATPSDGFVFICAGTIIGDWRDTLEKRPEEFKPSIEEANKLAQEFNPFTSIEDNQEQGMQQDNGWFERGELPPVGVVCEAYITNPEQWIEAEIVAHKDGFAIGWCKSVMMGCHGDKAREFRPIRTEREKAIARMHSDIAERWANCEEMAKHLIDKGWVKEKW